MEKRKIYGTIVGVILFILLMTGLTYAYFSWSSGNEKTNVNLTVSKGLEDIIVYNAGTSILGTDNYSLESSSSYTGGISATIEFWKKPSYTSTIYGQISLEILKMIPALNSTEANIGKTDTIKWVVTTYTSSNSTETLVNQGTFNGKSQGSKFAITENFALNNAQTYYKIYIWLDENAVSMQYPVMGETLSTEISVSASDTESVYGASTSQVLTMLGLTDKLKTRSSNVFTSGSPIIQTYTQSTQSSQTTNMPSTITGNKLTGTSYTFNSSTGVYTITNTSTGQSYNNDSVDKYTCDSNSTTCNTMYKIKTVNVSSATTNFSEDSTWGTTTATLSSDSDKAVASSYSFDGNYYQLTEPTTGASYSSSYVGYYTCNNSTGTNCTTIYKIVEISGTSITSALRKGRSANYNYVTSADILTATPSVFDDSDSGIYTAEDDIGMSYYFRGNINYNYVKFGKYTESVYHIVTNDNNNYVHTYSTSCPTSYVYCTKIADANDDMYWRIVRINGDGSIRLIYDGTSAYSNDSSSKNAYTGYSSYNKNYNDNAYVGYMYGTTGASTYANTHTNTNDSDLKKSIDAWYEKYLNNTIYQNYIIDAIYCNDRSTDGSGYGTQATNYSSYSRLGSNASPTLKCSQKNDRFTVSASVSGIEGNSALTYPVGTITADEMVYAGSYSNTNGFYNYLYSESRFHTMTPYSFSSSSSNVRYGQKGYYGMNAVNSVQNIRPTITLRSSILLEGLGTISNPYHLPA